MYGECVNVMAKNSEETRHALSVQSQMEFNLQKSLFIQLFPAKFIEFFFVDVCLRIQNYMLEKPVVLKVNCKQAIF